MSDKISPNVPAQARKQIREANRLISELNAKPGAQPAPAAPTQPAAAPANLPSIDLKQPTRFVPASSQNAPAAPAPAPTVAAQPPAPDPLAVSEHKYNVLQGKYNTETSRLLGAAQALQDENNRLMRRLAEQPTQQQPAAVRPEDQFDLSSVTAKEREEYGEELVQLMARIAKANSGAQIAALQRELQQMRGQVQQTAQATQGAAQDRIYQALDAWNTQWRVINVSQEFLDWLEVPDIISGLARKTGLLNAFETGNAQRVVAIFQAYVKEDSQSGSGSAPAPAQPQLDVNTLIAPGQPRGGAGEAPNSQGKRLWSENEIDEFYSRVQRNRISPDEKKATEADIH